MKMVNSKSKVINLKNSTPVGAKGAIQKNMKPRLNSSGILELVAIDFRQKSDEAITKQLMEQMKSVGFCQIVNVAGHNESRLKRAI